MFNLDSLMKGAVFFVIFLIVSFMIAWVGIVWWVSQDVLARSRDKLIIAASVALAAIFGPVGALMYLVIRPKRTIQEAQVEHMEREMMLHASSTIVCPACNRMAQEDFLACPHCGTALKYPCPNCTKLVQVDWGHCAYCSTYLAPDQRRLLLDQGGGRSPRSLPALQLFGPDQPARRATEGALAAVGQGVGKLWRGAAQSVATGKRHLAARVSQRPSASATWPIANIRVQRPHQPAPHAGASDQLEVLDQAIAHVDEPEVAPATDTSEHSPVASQPQPSHDNKAEVPKMTFASHSAASLKPRSTKRRRAVKP
jgi:RNA polymerase subunit RPABC4/transcription elongation factor Spt4